MQVFICDFFYVGDVGGLDGFCPLSIGCAFLGDWIIDFLTPVEPPNVRVSTFHYESSVRLSKPMLALPLLHELGLLESVGLCDYCVSVDASVDEHMRYIQSLLIMLSLALL